MSSVSRFLKSWTLRRNYLSCFPPQALILKHDPLSSCHIQHSSFPHYFSLTQTPFLIVFPSRSSARVSYISQSQTDFTYQSLAETYFLSSLFLVRFLSLFHNDCQNQSGHGHQNHRQKCPCCVPRAWL